MDALWMRLDPAIRDWVLVPILAIMLLVGMLRHNLTLLFTHTPRAPSRLHLREQRVLQRTALLRSHATTIPTASFHARRRHFMEAFTEGSYLRDPARKDAPPPNPMTDPGGMDTMMDGMKRNMMNVIPQTIIMGWITYFFSGFILVQLPFPLTPQFKGMLQRGIDTVEMDARWVSALSWYFLCLFGLRGVFTLILGEESVADGVKDIQAMSTLGMQGQPGQVLDYAGLFRTERENLELLSSLDDHDLSLVEQRLLSLYK